jgi:hypothetical protein
MVFVKRAVKTTAISEGGNNGKGNRMKGSR